MFQWLARLFSREKTTAMVIGQRPPAESASSNRENPPRTAPAPQKPVETAPPPDEPYNFSNVGDYDPADRNPVCRAVDEESHRIGELVTEKFLKSKSDLPAFPALATRILQVVKQPDVNMNKLVSIVSRDPAIATRILRVANSGFYSSTSEITSTRDAIVRIGLKDVGEIVAAASSGALFELQKQSTLSHFGQMMSTLWRDSMTCAFAATNTSMTLRRGDSEKAFLGGMLHDIGKMVALRILNELAEEGAVQKDFDLHRLHTIVEQIHHNLGFEAISLWNLPEFLLGVTMEHHGIDLSSDAKQDELHIIRVVSGLNQMRTNPFYPLELEAEVELSAKALSLSPQRVKALVSEVREYADKATLLIR